MNLQKAQHVAVTAAKSIGALLLRHLDSPKRANATTRYDIKLELDVRCQKLIESRLRSAFPEAGVLGEEGVAGDPNAEYRWVVDPIDGTVNFAYGIPHACVSIALQQRVEQPSKQTPSRSIPYPDGYQTLVGVVYEPFCDELWTANETEPARLNGKVIHVSKRNKLQEAIVTIGLSKSREHLDATLPLFNSLVRRVRKVRIMGAGALDLAYVATGRFDAYLERSISLWDIAAAGLILERAGGEVWRQPIAGKHKFRMIATNGLLRKQLKAPAEWANA
jgi:myo-inositol-1(or 4)-monophosphatase